jgi:preprotein translocase subunit YajC
MLTPPVFTNTINLSGVIILFFVLMMVLFNYSFLRAYKEAERRNKKLNETLIDLLAAKNAEILDDKKKLEAANDRRKYPR